MRVALRSFLAIVSGAAPGESSLQLLSERFQPKVEGSAAREFHGQADLPATTQRRAIIVSGFR